MGLTDDIKQKAKDLGVDLIGVAPVERFQLAPTLFQPQYYMKDAKNVIAMAIRILEGICDVHGSYDEEGKTIGPYTWFGYPIINWSFSWIALQIGKKLEDNGYRALPFPPAGFHYRQAEKGFYPDFLHKHAAVAAGLGEFGHNRLFVSPQFGAHNRVISIITNAPLDPDPMYSGPKICNRKECRDICVKICPMSAFQENTMEVRIGDRVYEYAQFDSMSCIWSTIVGKYLRGNDELPRYPGHDEIEEIIRNAGGRDKVNAKMNPLDRTFQQFTFTYTCGACLAKCRAPWK
jgi:epoxyqueuosine reductase